MKIADQIMRDETIDSFDSKIDMLLDLSRDLEDVALDALKMFKLTQKPSDYSENHWSNRLEKLLNNNQSQ